MKGSCWDWVGLGEWVFFFLCGIVDFYVCVLIVVECLVWCGLICFKLCLMDGVFLFVNWNSYCYYGFFCCFYFFIDVVVVIVLVGYCMFLFKLGVFCLICVRFCCCCWCFFFLIFVLGIFIFFICVFLIY